MIPARGSIRALPVKAVTYSRYGPPDVLGVEDVEPPTCGPGKLLIRVRAAEATKSDCELRSFRFPVGWFWLPLRLAWGVTRPRRRVLGGYFAGVVEDVGEGVARFQPGDEVFGASGFTFGAYGELVALPESACLAPKPANMTFEEAAAVPLGGLNALHFLNLGQIRPGERVLVNGAGGSIGSHAVQIAKARGAEVVAVDHPSKEAFLRGLGVDGFVDYTREDFAAGGAAFDVLLDMVARSSYAKCLSVLRPGGRYLMANPRGPEILRSFATTWVTDKTVRFALAKETVEELRDLTELIEAGQVRSIVDEVLPMERAAEAHRRVEAEERLGAIVLAIGGDA